MSRKTKIAKAFWVVYKTKDKGIYLFESGDIIEMDSKFDEIYKEHSLLASNYVYENSFNPDT